MKVQTRWGVMAAGVLLLAGTTARAVVIQVGEGLAQAGNEVVVQVTLNTEGSEVAGALNSIRIDPAAKAQVPVKMIMVNLEADLTATADTIVVDNASALGEFGTIKIDQEQIDYGAKDGNTLKDAVRGVNNTTAAVHSKGADVTYPTDVPDCQVGANIGKGAAFSFLSTNDGVKGVVLSFENVAPIANGATLYTCKFKVASDAALGSTINLNCVDPESSTSGGTNTDPVLLSTTCTNGKIGIAVGCLGDKNGNGIVSSGEAVSTLNDFQRGEATRNPSADRNKNGIISSGELVTVLNNFQRAECKP